ncbi:MAG: CHAD domain-containing protein [Bryobacterales bacterium]|nr:CHAD domain-containing protein [Bryobacterales bacterium]
MVKLRWDESMSAAGNARLRLPALARAYFSSGRKLVEAPARPALLHRFRLDTKALRYTLELFGPCYGPGLDRRLSVLRRIQSFLGAINDYSTTMEMLAGGRAQGGPELVRARELLAARARRKILEFRRYANRLFHDQAEERRWVLYLSRPRQC